MPTMQKLASLFIKLLSLMLSKKNGNEPCSCNEPPKQAVDLNSGSVTRSLFDISELQSAYEYWLYSADNDIADADVSIPAELPAPIDKCEGFRILLKKIQDTRKAQDAIFEVLEKQARADLDNCLNKK